jgi:hypothetical protein
MQYISQKKTSVSSEAPSEFFLAILSVRLHVYTHTHTRKSLKRHAFRKKILQRSKKLKQSEERNRYRSTKFLDMTRYTY